MGRRQATARPLAWRRPGPRGFTGAGGGAAAFIDPAPTWRGTTRQVCGLWPWAVGAGAPRVGVPMGQHLFTGEMVCSDVVSWFINERRIDNPSLFFLANPAKGKTKTVQRMLIGLRAYGVIPMVFADIRPDYVDMTTALGGQVIRLGGGTGHLNPLDNGIFPDAIDTVTTALAALEADPDHDQQHAAKLRDAATELRETMRARRMLRVATLVHLSRGAAATDREHNVLARALELLDARHPGVPVLGDLLAMVRSAAPELRQIAVAADQARYRELTENLEATLVGLVEGTRFGNMFSRPTSQPMRMDAPVVFDVSQLRSADADAQAAAMAACWSYGFGNIGARQVLADLDLAPRQLYVLVVDELHRVLRVGGGALVEVVDQTTRLNRQDGTGTIFITHTMRDLTSLPREEDRQKASGFVARAGYVMYGGLPAEEMGPLSKVTPLTPTEQAWLTEWAVQPPPDPTTGQTNDPNKGRFLIKVGTQPGIPFQVRLTAGERTLTDTNYRWNDTKEIS